MFKPFQEYIDQALGHIGIKTEAKAAQVCTVFENMIPGFFPNIEGVSKYVKPAYFKSGILVIKVENSVWAQEIMIKKTKILEKLKEHLGTDMVKNLRPVI